VPELKDLLPELLELRLELLPELRLPEPELRLLPEPELWEELECDE